MKAALREMRKQRALTNHQNHAISTKHLDGTLAAQPPADIDDGEAPNGDASRSASRYPAVAAPAFETVRTPLATAAEADVVAADMVALHLPTDIETSAASMTSPQSADDGTPIGTPDGTPTHDGAAAEDEAGAAYGSQVKRRRPQGGSLQQRMARLSVRGAVKTSTKSITLKGEETEVVSERERRVAELGRQALYKLIGFIVVFILFSTFGLANRLASEFGVVSEALYVLQAWTMPLQVRGRGASGWLRDGARWTCGGALRTTDSRVSARALPTPSSLADWAAATGIVTCCCGCCPRPSRAAWASSRGRTAPPTLMAWHWREGWARRSARRLSSCRRLKLR